MHVLVISTISDERRFWDALKKAHGRLPKETRWALAVASTDGGTAVNVLVHESVDAVRNFLEPAIGDAATTRYLEADAGNAVGLAK